MISIITAQLSRVLRRDDGNTTVEYAVLIAMILVFCLAALLSTGDVQKLLWFDTAVELEIIKPK